MTLKRKLFYTLVLLMIVLGLFCGSCGTAGHKGLETGTGYSDLDNSYLAPYFDD